MAIPQIKTVFMICLLSTLTFSGCGKSAATATPAATDTYGNLTISTPTTWTNRQVTVTGTLNIVAGGTLTLDNTTLLFSPTLEDTDSFLIQDGAFIAKNNSLIKTGSGKQWNLQAHGACSVNFQSTSMATNQSGLRMFDTCTFNADDSNVEEVQVHDNATVNLNNGASAYLVLFFTGGGATTTLNSGELVAGNVVTRGFNVATGTGTTGRVNINNSNIIGFQLDLVNNVTLNVTSGTKIVLAMHLNNVGNSGTQVTNAANITSGNATVTGSLDFSAYANPKFNYTSTQISSFNVYLTGTSNVSFTGTLNVTEPDAGDTSILTFGAGTSVLANLAMTHTSAQMIFNGSTLVEGGGAFPSFTAADQSVIRLNSVTALADAKVYATGQGQVHITPGFGWLPSMFQSVGTIAPGGIYVP